MLILNNLPLHQTSYNFLPSGQLPPPLPSIIKRGSAYFRYVYISTRCFISGATEFGRKALQRKGFIKSIDKGADMTESEVRKFDVIGVTEIESAGPT
jgi:hypothetical protein